MTEIAPTADYDPAVAKTSMNLSVSWRTIALVSVGTTVAGVTACSVALALVATSKKTDSLATLALSLAVLAFVVQIVVFIAQTFAAGRQLSRNEELYAAMRGLLEGLRGTAEGTHEALERHMDVLLKAATRTASEVANEGEQQKFDAEAFQRQVLDLVHREQSAAPTPATPPNEEPTAPMSAEDHAIVNELTTFPDEAASEDAVSVLESLGPRARAQLLRLADDEIDSRKEGNVVGLLTGADDEGASELLAHGLVTFVGNRRRSDGRRMAVLTTPGRSVARLVSARGQRPAWLGKA